MQPPVARSAGRLVSLAIAILAAACSSVPPLANTVDSPDALARAVLDAVARRDRPALDAIALGEQEFRDHVWPELPAARPERNLPFSYVWGDLRQKSEASVGRTLAEHGGHRLELVSIAFLGETTQYKSYLVRRKTELTVKDSTGAEQHVQLFGSVIEQSGRFKVFSYVVD